MAGRTQLCLNESDASTVRLSNHGNPYFMHFVKECIDELNELTNSGKRMTRRSMVIFGLIPYEDGMWKFDQLSSEFQFIINENMPTFTDKSRASETNA